MRTSGPESGGTFLALGGLGRKGLGPDWEKAGVVARLASNYRVHLPDPYSNPKTAPSVSEFAVVLAVSTLFGLWRGECRERWLLDLLPQPTKAKPVVLAGHSWGGGAVARLAAAYPDAVSRLVLVSPDVEESVAQRCFATPTLLLWAKDDYINPHLWTCRWRGHPNLTVHSTNTGGHRVLESHADIISEWLEKQDKLDGSSQR